jgi:hypothetical protein
MNHSEWRVLASYASGFEADLVLAQLESADIPAIRDNNDTVGLFGPGFQGPSARGIIVRVPADYLESAREIIGLPAHHLALVESAVDEEPAPSRRARRTAGTIAVVVILGLILFGVVSISMLGASW